MTGSYRPSEPTELCRLANALVAALLQHAAPGPLDLQAVDLISSGRMSEHDHTTCLVLVCAQRLHNLGRRRPVDTEELYFVAGTLGFMLGRLDPNGARTEFEEVHHRLHEIAMDLSF